MIRWNSVTAADGLETDGYRLYMTTFNGGNASLVYDGSTLPLKLYYNVTGLLTGQRYAFAVTTINFNGESIKSPEKVLIVCIPPYGFPKPYFISATDASITVGWQAPSDDGGCPI